ncbi:hypothetical protein WJX81_007322 [Elliptochloris bilobata]|uniref:carbonic anhydrase n=1 Tax=Elliptochloris bilobata TaxID=381761 RepID=A0AAW1RW60_9CHLO
MTHPGKGSWLGLLAINLFVVYNAIRLCLAARLLTGLRTYLVPEPPGAEPPPQASPRGRGNAAQRRRSRQAEARPAGKNISVGGANKVTAIELPAAALAVAEGFQELEWLLLAGVLAPLNVAASEAAALALGWPRCATALAVCAGAAGYALFCLYTVAEKFGVGFKRERRNGLAFGVVLAAALAPLLALPPVLLMRFNTAGISLGLSDAAGWLSSELAARGVSLSVLDRVRVPRAYIDRTLALLAGGLAALLLPAALQAGRAARLVLLPPAWGREYLAVLAAQRALVALAAAAPAAACALWAAPVARALHVAPGALVLAQAGALLLCGALQAAAVRTLTQGFLSRGLVQWRARKQPPADPAAQPAKGAAKADGARVAIQSPEVSAEAATDVRAALVMIYSQRCQVAVQLLAPAVVSLALGAALLACAVQGGEWGPRRGAAVPDQAAALLGDVVAPMELYASAEAEAEGLAALYTFAANYCAASGAWLSKTCVTAAKRAAAPQVASAVQRSALLRSALVGFVACPCCARLAAASETTWGYTDAEGPRSWGGTCASGSRQSPVDLPARAPPGAGHGPLGQLHMDYARGAQASVLNTGHGTMQVNVAPGSWLCAGERKWQLLQWHFHAPSEHTRGGAREAMEAHLVHRDAQGRLAVLAVLLEAGTPSPNQALARALAAAPAIPGTAAPLPEPLDVAAEAAVLMKGPDPNPYPDLGANGEAHRPYLHYEGSLTTPPCSEGVDWLVLDRHGSIADNQVLAFEEYVGALRGVLATNARPLQPLGGRELEFDDFA